MDSPAPPTASLGARTKRALGWRFATVYAKFALQTAVTVVLSRLLPVEDFGLLTQALIIINFVAVISEVGMAPALVQKRDLTPQHIRTGFTISLLSGLLLTAALWLSAPLFEGFYKTPGVTPILRALSWTFFFISLSTVGGALLQRKLDFRSLFVMDTASHLAYGVVGVTLALRGYGVWALAYAALVQAVAKAILAFAFSHHSLRLEMSRPEARELLRFGAGMSATRLILHLARNADNLVVGRYLGAVSMGLYARAYTLMTMPILEIAGAMNAVLFPAYSEIQHEHERLKRVYFQNLAVVTLRLFPVLVTMAALAPEIMRGVYGPPWAGAAPPLRILCFGGFFLCVHNLGDALARAKGAVAGRFWRHAIYAVGVFLLARLGATKGTEGVALGVTVALGLQYLLMAQLANQLLQASWRDFFAAQAPGALLSAVSGGVAWLIATLLRSLHWPDLAILAVAATLAAVSALGTLFMLPRAWLPPMIGATRDKLRAKLGISKFGKKKSYI